MRKERERKKILRVCLNKMMGKKRLSAIRGSSPTHSHKSKRKKRVPVSATTSNTLPKKQNAQHSSNELGVVLDPPSSHCSLPSTSSLNPAPFFDSISSSTAALFDSTLSSSPPFSSSSSSSSISSFGGVAEVNVLKGVYKQNEKGKQVQSEKRHQSNTSLEVKKIRVREEALQKPKRNNAQSDSDESEIEVALHSFSSFPPPLNTLSSSSPSSSSASCPPTVPTLFSFSQSSSTSSTSPTTDDNALLPATDPIKEGNLLYLEER